MPRTVHVFVSYNHQDASYLEEDSLLGFLRGLESEHVEFWTDRQIVGGRLWHDEIARQLTGCDLALVLVSQAFLDSAYCQNTEILGLLVGSKILLPVILSPCEWQRHEWLASRQFLPTGHETVEEHYTEAGPRRRLFLKVRDHLRQQIESVRSRPPAEDPAADGAPADNPFGAVGPIRDAARFVGRREELRRLRRLLTGGSVALVAGPKIGKTSLLVQLVQSWSGPAIGPVDFQLLDDLDDFYTELARWLEAPAADWMTLREDLRQREVLMVLDELDAAPERGIGHTPMARFRALLSSNPGFKLVVAARNPLKDLFPDQGLDSPVFNLLQPMRLDEMSEGDARELLAHPWDPEARAFDAAAVDELLRIAGRHPFKLKRAAFHRYQTLLDPTHDWRDAWGIDMDHMF